MSANSKDLGNLTYVRDLRPSFTNGLKVRPWEARKKVEGVKRVEGRSLVTILGGVTRDNYIQGPFKTIPLDMGNKPILSQDGLRAVSGKFEKVDVGDGKMHLMMRAYDLADSAFYVHLQSGFHPGANGSVDGHVNKLLYDGITPSVCGSFSLDGASVQLEGVEGLELTEEQATRQRWAVGKHNPVIGAPGLRHDLWRIPSGAAVLVQTVEGVLFRIIAGKDALQIVDAAAYQKVFMDLEMQRRARNAEARARRAAEKGATPPASASSSPQVASSEKPKKSTWPSF